jgi:5-methyltetrahydropteroyltriglutamate--homocysteine methyltransferase
MNLPKHLLPTTVVGSYPQPEWLVDRAMLSKVGAAHPHACDVAAAGEHLEEAQDDATIVAIRDMERAGIDIVTDGEIRRESYSNRFATALDGIDDENPAMITSRSGHQTPVPRVTGPVKRRGPVELHDMNFLRQNTDRAAKITLPGPFTMSQQAERRILQGRRGAGDGVRRRRQRRSARPAKGRRRRDPARRALGSQQSRPCPPLCGEGDQPRARRHHRTDRGASVLRLCRGRARLDQAGRLFLPRRTRRHNAEQISIEAAQPKLDLGVLRDLSSKKIMLGVLDLGNPEIESADAVADRSATASSMSRPTGWSSRPDCGMKYMPRHVAFGKLKAMCDAAATVRKEIS